MAQARWIGAALAGGLALGLAGGAAAQPAPAAPAQADPAFEAAKAAFEALPEADRKAIQDALVWTGDLNTAPTGTFGKRTHDALVAYQRRAKLAPNGVLDGRARAELQAAAQRARDAVKFAVVADPKTGVRIGVPERLLPKRDVNPNGGSRWQSADDKITLDTRAIPSGDTDLAALFERNVGIQTPGRQVTYKVLRPDFFVITGETPTGKFYTRYAAGPAGLRGFSLGYDKAVAKDFDRTVIAIANSFLPFPDAGPAASPAPSPAVAAVAPAAPPRRPAVIEPPRPPSLIASGLVVAPRRVLTGAEAEGCPDLRVAGAKARVLKADKAKGLALLETEGARTPRPLALGPAPDGELIVLSFAGSEPNLVATPATAASGRLVAPLQAGASGGPALSRSGALAGLVGPLPAAPRMVAGVVPPLTHPMIAAEAVSAFLTEAGVAPPAPAGAEAPRSAGEIVAALGSAVVPIACAR